MPAIPGMINGGALLQSPSALPGSTRALTSTTAGAVDYADYDPAGTASSAVAAHAAASDPHGDRAYAAAQAAAAQAASQPLDSDLTAIAALSTTSFGRALLALADAAALRTAAGTVIGTDVQAYDAQLASLAGLSYAGNASKVIQVNSGESAFELATPTATDSTKVPLSTITQAGGTILGTGNGSVVELAPPSIIGQSSVFDNSANKMAAGFPISLRDYYDGSTNGIGNAFHRWCPTASFSALSSGRLNLYLVSLPKGLVITSISFVTSGGTALSGGNNQWFGIFDANRVPLRFTADDTSTAWATSTRKTLNLTSTYTVPTTGLYYIGICVNATTVPTLQGANLGSAIIQGFAPIAGGTSSTGLTNTASCPNPAGAITASGTLPYFEWF